MRSDLPYLKHIVDSITAIETYVVGGRDVFLAERLIQDAFVRNFEIIGEAAGGLSPAPRDAADIPCGKVIAFRNRLIHSYWNVDPRLVWDVIEHELPVLKDAVKTLLSRMPQP